jgi:hypothetical protein
VTAFTGEYGAKMEFLSGRFQDVWIACGGGQFYVPHRQLSLSRLGYDVNDNQLGRLMSEKPIIESGSGLRELAQRFSIRSYRVEVLGSCNTPFDDPKL